MDYTQVYDDGTVTLSRSEHGWHLVTRPAVTTLLVTDDHKIIVIQEKKDSTGRMVINCPGGMIEPGETSEQAATRECEEEVGFVPMYLEKFTSVQTDFPDTYVDFYIGRNLKQGTIASWINKGHEQIDRVEEFTWQEVYDMALNAIFNDPRLVVAILQLAKQPAILKSFELV